MPEPIEEKLGIERVPPETVVTPGMIEAGIKAFGRVRGDDIGAALERAYRAMFQEFSGGTPPPPPPTPPPPPGGPGVGEGG